MPSCRSSLADMHCNFERRCTDDIRELVVHGTKRSFHIGLHSSGSLWPAPLACFLATKQTARVLLAPILSALSGKLGL